MAIQTLVARALLASGVLVVSTMSFAQAPAARDLVGTWKMTMTSPQGTHPGTLVVREESGNLVATMDGEMGKLPATVTTSEKGVTIAFTVDYQGPLAVVLTGSVTGDTMKGLVDYGNGMAGGDFEGSREAASTTSEAGVTGTWTITSAEGGSGWELTLTQDGTNVTGRLENAGQGLVGDVKGTLEGSALKLQVSGQFAGTMNATLENGTLSGSFDVEGTAGRWTGARKP